jgi:hypothetical protein
MQALTETDVQVFIFASSDDEIDPPEWLTVFELRLDDAGHTKIKG